MILRYNPFEWDIKAMVFYDLLKEISEPENPFYQGNRIEDFIQVFNALNRKLPPFHFMHDHHSSALELLSKYDEKLDTLTLDDAKELKLRADIRYGHAIFRGNMNINSEIEELLLKAEHDMNLVFEKTKKYFFKQGLVLKALAEFYEESGNFEQASNYYEKAEQVLRKVKKNDFHKVSQLPITLMKHAFLMLKMEKFEEAKNFASKCVKSFSWADIENQKEKYDQLLPRLLTFTINLLSLTPDHLNSDFNRSMEVYMSQLNIFTSNFPEYLEVTTMYVKNIYVQAVVAEKVGEFTKAAKLYEKSANRLLKHVQYYAENRIDLILKSERSHQSINMDQMVHNPEKFARIKDEIFQQEKERAEIDPGYFAVTIQKSILEMHKKQGNIFEQWKSLVILNQLLGNMMKVHPIIMKDFKENLDEVIKVGDTLELDKNKRKILQGHKVMKQKLDQGLEDIEKIMETK